MPTISQARDTILQQLHNSEQAATRLFTGLARVQVNWQPSGGKSWSIWQCFDHLARTNTLYSQAMMEAIANPRLSATGTTEITPGWFGRWFIANLEPPVRTRLKALAKVVPAANGDAQDALRAFLDSHAEVRRVMESWERADFNRVRFENPFVPVLRFTVGTGLMIINAHDRRHLWQAGCVKEAESFPAA